LNLPGMLPLPNSPYAKEKTTSSDSDSGDVYLISLAFFATKTGGVLLTLSSKGRF
jgi:hypothetical protein